MQTAAVEGPMGAPLVRTRSATPLLQSPASFTATFFRPWSMANPPLPCHQLATPAGDIGLLARGQSVKPVFSSVRLNSAQPCYTTNDWANYNKASQRQTNKERAAAEQLRTDAWTTVRFTEQRTRVSQGDASKKLHDRVKDIEFWHRQLAEEARLICPETELLAEHVRLLSGSLAHTAGPLLLAEECQEHREKRTGIDRVQDDVERQLSREVECIRKCQDQMRKLVDRARAQLKLNEVALEEITKDLRNKGHARVIDDRMSHLSNRSPHIALHPGIESLDNSRSIPDSWARFSHGNITRSQRCRAASEKMRSEIGGLMRSCANEIFAQYNAVNAAFNARIREITEARNYLQGQLQSTVSEIYNAERSIVLLRDAIADKEAPLKVAQTRLEARSKRLEVEICSDVPNNALQREVLEIRDSIRTLTERLRSLEMSLARLHATRDNLEAGIRVKENSLRIDAKLCMAARKNSPPARWIPRLSTGD